MKNRNLKPIQFVEALRQLKIDNTFNPYSNRCEVHDLSDAPERRSQTLLTILERAAEREIDSLWIGRDLGYRGGRRTGLALTDDAHIHEHAERWEVSVQRPTRGEAVAERTAAVIWSALSQIEACVFLWNVFPLHPHKPRNPFSNRPHNSLERGIGEKLLSQLISLLKPRRLVAIGNDAVRAAHRLAGRHRVVQMRHPSYGGQTRFLEQIRELYDLPQTTKKNRKANQPWLFISPAAHERLEERQRSNPFESPADVEEFFRSCDVLEGPEREPDWEEHLHVIAESRGRMAASS